MKLFELYNKRPVRKQLREDKTLQAAIKLCEGIVNLLEASYEGGIDFEPQDDFKNVKGINIDDNSQRITGYQDTTEQDRAKLNKAWVMLLSKMKNLDPAQRKILRPKLQQVANMASKRKIKLIPSAEQVFNL